MLDDIERTLFPEEAIHARLDQVAAEITRRFEGKELTVVAILNGSLIFAADLLRRVPLPLRLECISVSSYHGGTESSGTVTFDQLTLPDLSGRHVLVLDDILDTGRTLAAVCRRLQEHSRPLSLEVCVLLQKRKMRAEELTAEFVGFEIGDEFVVGYGLDFQERYRNLPFIGTLRRSAQG